MGLLTAHYVTGPADDPYRIVCVCPIGEDHTEADMEGTTE